MINIKFHKKPINEFAQWVLYKYFDSKSEYFSSFRITLDEKLIKYTNLLEEDTSSFLKNELDFFYKTNILPVIFYGYIDDYEISTLDDYFEVFEKSSLETLFNYLGGCFLGETLIGDNSGWNLVKHDLNLMENYIKDLPELSEEDKKIILDLYHSPEETKMRIRYLLNQLAKIYSTFENEISDILDKEEKRYIELYKKDKAKFLDTNWFNRLDINLKSNITINLCISYFSVIGIRINDLSTNNVWGYIGYKNIDAYKYRHIENHFEKFLKLISDKTRQKILFLLAERPWYTHELAKELKLAPSTINYHLQNFVVIDVVSFKETDNKCYYVLNKENVKLFIDLLNSKLKLN